MKLLNKCYFGQIARCPHCGAILGYEPKDVSDTQNISCLVCGFTMWVPFNPTYDGIIKESEEKENDAVV